MTMLPNDPRMDVVLVAYRAMRPAPPDVRLDELGAVCPVDDTMLMDELRGLCCPTCLAWWDRRGRAGMWLADDRGLAAAVVAEDDLEAAGLLAADDRRTCHTCQVWASPAHVASWAHWSAIDKAADTVTPEDVVTYPELGEPVDGCSDPICRAVCGNCRPWLWPDGLDHDVDQVVLDGQLVDEPADDVTQRLRRLDRRCAGAVAAAVVVAGSGYAAGRVMRPYEHLVPDALIWALAGLLFAAGAVVLAVALLLRWRDARRFAGTDLGEVSDGR
jgi:hypothetical protein